MSKLKIVEIVVIAISALVSAAKGVLKFIDCINKIKKPITNKA